MYHEDSTTVVLVVLFSISNFVLYWYFNLSCYKQAPVHSNDSYGLPMIDLLYSLYTTTDIMTLINKIDDGKCIMSSSCCNLFFNHDKKNYPIRLTLALYLRNKLQEHIALNRSTVSPSVQIFYSAQLFLDLCKKL